MKPITADAAWWRGCSIYQIYPRSFQDTTGNGVGDLKGVTRRLGHVASLGVDAIWLSPFFTSPMADMGYDVSDYCEVDPLFGTLADFDELIAEAHRLGLKVIIDQVLSHSSDQHPWFRESRASRKNPKADWYVWADAKPDGTAPNNWLSVFGGPAWEWDSVRRQYYLHQFLTSQPDLNFHHPQVQDALLGAVRFWLERGVDGFRLDTVNHYFHDLALRDNPPVTRGKTNDVPETNPYGFQDHLYDKSRPENIAFLQRFRALLDEYDGRTSVGEVGDADRSLRTVAAYTEGGDKLHMCYTFDLLSPTFAASHVRASVEAFETIVRDGWVCWAFSNHDVTRHVSRWAAVPDEASAVARFAIALLCSLRGSICLYQGEELGLTEAELQFEDLRDPYGIRFWPGYKGRDGCRTPIPWQNAQPFAGFSTLKPWLPVPDEHRAAAVDRQEAVAGSVLEHYRAMLALRKATSTLIDGDIAFLGRRSKTMLSFLRESGMGRVFCAFNFGQERGEVRIPGPATPLDGPSASPGVEIGRDRATLPPLGWLIAHVD
jgi:alpha-glucosidase